MADPPQHRQIQITRTALTPDTLVLTVDGEIDVITRARWRDALADALGSPRVRLVICDCTRVEFMSIDGFLALVDAQRAARRRGVRLEVMNPPSTLVRLLTVIRQASVPDLDIDLDMGVAAVAPLCAQASSN